MYLFEKGKKQKSRNPLTSTCPSQDIPIADLRFWIPGLEFSNVNANRTGTHIKMNVIIIPLAGHYRRFLFLFLCVNLFKRKLFVTTICSLKINKPLFFFQETDGKDGFTWLAVFLCGFVSCMCCR